MKDCARLTMFSTTWCAFARKPPAPPASPPRVPCGPLEWDVVLPEIETVALRETEIEFEADDEVD